jgi:hypothetical protein
VGQVSYTCLFFSQMGSHLQFSMDGCNCKPAACYQLHLRLYRANTIKGQRLLQGSTGCRHLPTYILDMLARAAVRPFTFSVQTLSHCSRVNAPAKPYAIRHMLSMHLEAAGLHLDESNYG